MASGGIPVPLVEWLAGASLIPIPKKDGGVRPIAVGDTFRRVTSKLVLLRVLPSAPEYLLLLQNGVGVPSAAEQTVHCCRILAASVGDTADLFLDLRNTFNIISRRAVLSQVSLVVPAALSWVEWCYGKPSLGTTLSSSRGVQQGDPLGPLLFHLAWQTVPLALKQLTDAALHGRYHSLAVLVPRSSSSNRRLIRRVLG